MYVHKYTCTHTHAYTHTYTHTTHTHTQHNKYIFFERWKRAATCSCLSCIVYESSHTHTHTQITT